MNTRNFEDLGFREIAILRDILTAYLDSGLPEDFEEDEITWEFNSNSGNVFLVNSQYQVCMLNGGKLESFYSLPYEGHEGFAENLKMEYENGNITHEEDIEALRSLKIIYTMKDLKKYYEDLKENVSAEEYEAYKPTETEEEIYIAISNEEIYINKQDNSVISTLGNYNSVHDIVEDLLNR